MGKELPVRAERFLYALSRNLKAVSSDERDTVLLELRSHLVDRAQQGEVALDAALDDLGDPADFAAMFDQGRGEPLAPVPETYAMPRRRMRMGEVVGEVHATFLASRDGLMMVGLVLAAVQSLTAFLLWTNVRLGLDIESWATLAVQVVVSLLAYCAGYRIVLTSDRRPWRISASTFRFAAAMIAVDSIGFGGMIAIDRVLTSLVAMAANPDAFAVAGIPIWSMFANVVAFCLTLRIQPWLVALAIGRRGLTIGASWRGTSGQMLNILRGWLALGLPFYFLLLGLNSFAVERVPIGLGLLALAVLAGILSIGVGFSAILLNATIYRWAVGEPIPSPRPFATEPPDPSSVEEARERLATLLGSSRAGSDAGRRADGLPRFAND